MLKNILFVCTGNTCRSPMAEGLMRLAAERAGLQLTVRSAGVSAMDGSPVSRHSSKLLEAKGASASAVSRALTGRLLDEADLILTMTQSHKRLLLQRFPHAVEKTYTLKEYVEDDPRTAAARVEREMFLAELEVKRALSQTITPDERSRALALEHEPPDYDIADPFGGSFRDYRACAEEIERCVDKLARKLKAQTL